MRSSPFEEPLRGLSKLERQKAIKAMQKYNATEELLEFLIKKVEEPTEISNEFIEQECGV